MNCYLLSYTSCIHVFLIIEKAKVMFSKDYMSFITYHISFICIVLIYEHAYLIS